MANNVQNIIDINGKKVEIEAPASSWVVFENCVCVQLEEGEDNLICIDKKGKLLWRGSEFYKKNTKALKIAQVGNKLLKVVWYNNDVKVIDVKKRCLA